MEPGDVLGKRYKLLNIRGRGGMAEVWEAQDLVEPQHVAIKFLRPDRGPADSLDDEDWYAELSRLRGRFRREGALLGKLHHPGIPELYGQGDHRGDPYLVMRLVEGKDLHKFLQLHTPSVAVASAIGYQVADALACAHDLPVVHRDLKPYNLLVDKDGRLVLIDFGIARPLWPGVTDYTPAGSTVGSRGYEAPEQILGRQITPMTDLYALGCVLYHLFTGRPPFTGERLTDQHLHDSPIPLSYFIDHIPADLEALVLKLLEKNPEDRPGNAREVSAVLRAYAPSEGDPAPAPRLDPDPTMPLRFPDAFRSPEPTPSPVAVQRRRRAASFLSKRSFQEALVDARAEIDADDPGDAVERLAELLAPARRSWGTVDPHIRDAYRAAADGLRIAGQCSAAATLYEDLVALAQDSDDPSDVADWLEGILGAAECRIPFGDLQGALAALSDVIGALPRIEEERALQLRRRCRELGLELSELGYDEKVSAMLISLGVD